MAFKYIVSLLSIFFTTVISSCKKEATVDPLIYAQKMTGNHSWVGTITISTYLDTVYQWAFDRPIVLINDLTLLFADSSKGYHLHTDTLAYIYCKGTILTYTTKIENTNKDEYDTLFFDYSNKKISYSGYRYDSYGEYIIKLNAIN